MAVRETSVSRHNGGPVEGPPQTSQYNSAVMVRGISEGLSIEGSLNWGASQTAIRLIVVVFAALALMGFNCKVDISASVDLGFVKRVGSMVSTGWKERTK